MRRDPPARALAVLPHSATRKTVDQGVTGKSTLQVGFTGFLLWKQAAVCRLFRPDLSTHPSRYPRSCRYVCKQTESTQEYCVSESISNVLRWPSRGVSTSRDKVSWLPPPEAARRGVIEIQL